ncbi:MAG: tRNA3(Ser)-specific nuclease WapA [Chroococcopsis gigantea SAG 12.99]|nr:tRNA3(Ser)-specific nuclease WapA [Chroococcopsis gigantea SAG 12.99]
MIEETNAFGKSRTYTYDADGNKISQTDRDGRITTYIYDALNRETTENWLDSNGNSIYTLTNTYDANSELIAVSDPYSSYHYTYDANGRQTAVDNVGTPGAPRVLLTYNYDANGNIISVTDKINGVTGATTNYSYDVLNQITRITQTGNGVENKRVDFIYDSLERLISLNRYSDLNGTQLLVGSSYIYDNLSRLQSLTHNNSSSTIAFYNFSHDAAGRITQIQSIDGTNNYSYDVTDQLTGASATNESYSYDANGNRTNTGYSTGTDNQLVSDGTYNYRYDGEGNLRERTEIATAKIRTFEWDYRNRLVAVIDQNSAGVITQEVDYTYDALNQRIAKSIASSVTRFVYDRDNILVEFTATSSNSPSSLNKRYLYGLSTGQKL